MPGPGLEAEGMVGNETVAGLLCKVHGLEGWRMTVTSMVRMIARE